MADPQYPSNIQPQGAQDQPTQQSFVDNDFSERQYSVTPVPAHTHNGTDSFPIDPNDLFNAQLYFQVRQTNLTSAQVLALHTTPITLVPAVGTIVTAASMNSVIIVGGITAKIYSGSSAYTGANNLEFRYTDASGAKVTADIPNTFINTSANSKVFGHVAGVTTFLTPVANSPIIVSVPVANPGAGNGRIVISVFYRVITL